VNFKFRQAVAVDEQQQQQRRRATTASDEEIAAIVGRAVQTLYKRLNGIIPAAVAKKVPMVGAGGYRVRHGSASGGADDLDDAAALAFSTALVDVAVGGGSSSIEQQQQQSSPAPSNSSGFPSDGKCAGLYIYIYIYICIPSCRRK